MIRTLLATTAVGVAFAAAASPQEPVLLGPGTGGIVGDHPIIRALSIIT
ncbi:hypothetical protein GTA62_18345 [Roseobacter sp. HKCCD9010]|nr:MULTISPECIES: hypothetical protein [unclassified Roseobacter]MBF9051733.1 hypothetical protein [Rhodobacterales bacterium HKCCD4356]NNV13726.1 hypothetical protein [Roseobacter sp. HKCCD7357]NNV17751.1 hypothetical protein [Roseobacter sp. HKCCD8768]NNV27358.1 hypothetical protein [Roseobacter sp. HKCCD8192]NNV31478.1 hypothetical protein [Roseobacter sp. HKCCD9061]